MGLLPHGTANISEVPESYSNWESERPAAARNVALYNKERYLVTISVTLNGFGLRESSGRETQHPKLSLSSHFEAIKVILFCTATQAAWKPETQQLLPTGLRQPLTVWTE